MKDRPKEEEKTMRIKRIFVEGLFNTFDHEIVMKMDDRITIIHSPNGFGKTTLLRMVDGLFNARYNSLRATPFNKFGVECDDGNTLEVTKIADQSQRNGKSLAFSLDGRKTFHLKSFGKSTLLKHLEARIEYEIPDLTRISANLWRTPNGETLDLDDVQNLYGEFFPEQLRPERDEPPWFDQVRKQVRVRLIGTERLAHHRKASRRERTAYPTPAILVFAKELAGKINSMLAQYAELSQSLDRTFPERLISQSSSEGITEREILQRLTEFEGKRKRLINAGLLDKDEDSHFSIPSFENPEIDEAKASILAVYVADVEKKLGVFDVLAAKIDLFKTIINKRFRHKQMVIRKDKGITFVTDTGHFLDAARLSTGEQHEVVMLYEFLFRVRQDSLILIDEPEISLHVAWQKQFLEDLLDVAKLSKFDVLLATHSPQIINDRWDLTVELQDTRELQESTR